MHLPLSLRFPHCQTNASSHVHTISIGQTESLLHLFIMTCIRYSWSVTFIRYSSFPIAISFLFILVLKSDTHLIPEKIIMKWEKQNNNSQSQSHIQETSDWTHFVGNQQCDLVSEERSPVQ